MARIEDTPASPPCAGPPAYLGQHARGVDNGRVILPADWRTGDAPKDFKIVVWPIQTQECLLVLPPARFEVLWNNLQALLLPEDSGSWVERTMILNTSAKSLDSYGRLPLPEEAAQTLGIEKEALLVGRLNKFEIWNPERFAARRASLDPQLIANALKNIRV